MGLVTYKDSSVGSKLYPNTKKGSLWLNVNAQTNIVIPSVDVV